MAERLSVDPPLRKGMRNQSGESSLTVVNVDEVEHQTEEVAVEVKPATKFAASAAAGVIM